MWRVGGKTIARHPLAPPRLEGDGCLLSVRDIVGDRNEAVIRFSRSQTPVPGAVFDHTLSDTAQRMPLNESLPRAVARALERVVPTNNHSPSSIRYRTRLIRIVHFNWGISASL
jgi:hypothetical protein